MKDNYNLALLKVHFTAVLFGLTGVLGAVIQSSSEVLVLGRVIIACAALGLFFLIKHQPLTRLSKQDFSFQILLSMILMAHWVTFYIAIKAGGVAVGTLGFASFPAFAALSEVLLFKERLKLREFWLLVAISIGLILVSPNFEFGDRATQGLLWGILSGAIYGLLAVLNRKNMGKLSGAQASFWQYFFGILLLLPFSYQQLPTVPAIDWFWIACMGLLCTTLAYTLFVSSLKTINARTAAMIISLEPVYAVVIAWIWLGETPSLRMIIGGLVILISVAIVNFKK